MKERLNNLGRASAFRIAFSIALLSGSAILLGLAAPRNNTNAPRQGPGRASGITAPAIVTTAAPSPTPGLCNKIVFRGLSGGIFIMNADGSGLMPLSQGADFNPSLSGAGAGKIAFHSFPQRNIFIMDVDGSNRTPLTATGPDQDPSISGDGSKIAFLSTRDLQGEIYVMNASPGSIQNRLTTTGHVAGPSFDGNGNKIVFWMAGPPAVVGGDNVDGGNPNNVIYIMNANGSGKTPLTSTGFDSDPSISGDGSKIVFASTRDQQNEIYVMNANGSNQTRLTTTGDNYFPSINQDGSKVVINVRENNSITKIYVMNATPGSPRTLLADGIFPSFGVCPSTALIGLEVTQGVQDLNNSVPLVEHKKTFVRAHVKNLSVNPNSGSASLTAKDVTTGNILGTIPNSNVGGQIAIPRDPIRVVPNDSFLFEVPPAWRRGTIEFSFAGNEVSFPCQTAGDTCSNVTVTFQPVEPFRMEFVSMTYTDAAANDHTPGPADISKVMKQFVGRYPISVLDSVTRATRSNFNPCLGLPAFTSIRTELNDLRNSDCRSGPCKDFYQGLLADQGACVPTTNINGEGDLPGHASAVFVDTGDTIPAIHEQAHVLGLKHTKYTGGEVCELFGFQVPCTTLEGDGTLSLSKRPYAVATAYGFDVNESSAPIHVADSADFMSYGRPRWPSRVNYKLLFEGFSSAAAPRADVRLKQNEVLANQTVIIDGIIQFNGPTGQLGAVIVNTTPVSIPLPSPGEYSVRLENSQGTELARYSFNPMAGSEDSSTGVISLLLPWDPNARRIVLLHNEDVLDSRLASANFPTANVTFPNGGEVLVGPSATFNWTAADPDGDPLSYTLEYSADNGTTWQTLAINWNHQAFQVDLTKLHGSNQALIRVTASDGFNCTVDQSNGTFTVPNHAPATSISSPENNRLYVGAQMIILEGTGLDVEDGALADSRLAWSSDLNGPLGTGGALALDAMTLQEGTHMITLTATDSTNQVGSASIPIRVFRNRPTLPAALSVAPGEMTFRLVKGQVAAQTVAIRNSGDGDVAWSAGADQPWIQLSSGNGSTPSNLDITADATGLALGEYSGHVTIDAPGAADSPQVVTVNLLVQDEPVATVVAVSRKTHGPAGNFDIDLPLTGTPGVECRSGGASSDYQVIFSFANSVSFMGAAVTAGTGTVSATSGNGTTLVTVALTGVTNAQRITLTLSGVSNGSTTGDVSVPMGLLVGDANGDGFVNAGDALQTRQRSGQATNATNFRSDVNTDGVINSGDTTAVRARAGTFLP